MTDTSTLQTLDEFSLIRRYFHRHGHHGPDAGVVLGPGDDAAILAPPAGQQLVMTQDTSLGGRHFPDDMDAADVGYRCLAVNLSDLAAMGADPLWFLLSLTLPDVNEDWLAGFADGMFSLADQAGISLVGGDVTRGSLSVSIQATGAVPPGQALRRDGAQAGDRICVGGVTGAGLLGLQQWQQGARSGAALEPFRRPSQRLELGQAHPWRATACIDISDGVLADLGHILAASGRLGACLQEDALPLGSAVLAGCSDAEQRRLQLQGGDDYLLLFTLPAQESLPPGCYCLGTVESQEGLRLAAPDGTITTLHATGWQHF
ncbi:MAG: thiamine-phosphate kinase [Alcanivorax sp.]|uniref:thiamine-phosphate kinase n=1 Tax=Alcanivorax sp. TaxID=1872427 RepID=UPI003DA70B60